MSFEEALKVLKVSEKSSYEEIRDSYCLLMGELKLKYGLDSKEFEKEGLRYATAFCLLMNTGKYDKEKCLSNFYNFLKKYYS